MGDSFDAEGIEVEAEYNSGHQREALSHEDLTITISGEAADEYVFEEPGVHTVRVAGLGFENIYTEFDIEVKDAFIESLEIRKLPEKQLYFMEEELKLDGITVYAHYSDGSAVRLMRGEFQTSELDTTSPGEKKITISHKGITSTFTVQVKEKEVTGMEVTTYPKTTYFVGEELEFDELEVSRVFDNGERLTLAGNEFGLDTSNVNTSIPGEYEVVISSQDATIQAITFLVTVRENQVYEWKSIRFGQSSSDARNFLEVKDNGVVELTALEGGGKVTADHDGIIFYYTEVDALEDNFHLTANINVKEYAKNPHDGQESFGIMARDAIGPARDASVFASNIAGVGGYSGGTRNDNGTQGFIRTGVESPDGAGSKGIQSKMLHSEKPQPNNTYPEKEYQLTLAKTNSGYEAQLNDGEKALFYEPDLLQVQDDKIYVGFYAARLATIEVSDIQFNVSATASDAPKVTPPKEPITPEIEILSLDKTSKEEYELKIRTNVDGVAEIRQGLNMIAQEVEVVAGEVLTVPTDIVANGKTNFTITYLPDDTELLTSYKKLITNFTVAMKTFGDGGDIFVSPQGTPNGTGTESFPLDLDTAIAYVKEGQKIIVTEGQYVRKGKLDIKKYNDGTKEARKHLVAAPGTRPVIDFNKRTEGVVLSGNYWHIEGLDFARSAGNTKGFTVGGSHNIIENSRFYEHGDTGLQISRTDGSDNKADWPSHNLILNSTAFDNRDPSDNNADGFAAKLTAGEGNIFRGCIAHNNIDDGWDLYAKAGTGAIGAVVIEDSIAYNNGFLTDGTVGAGDQNGFKLGGEGIHVPHVIKNSIAFGNGAYGFTSNSNPGVIAIDNIAFNNGGGNLSFTTYSHIETDFTINGFLSLQRDYQVRDVYPAHLRSNKNFFFNGTVSENNKGVVLSEESFKSLEPVLPFERAEDGSIILGDFLQLVGEEANISFTPKVLNTKGANGNGKGPVATVHLEAPAGYSVDSIQTESIYLNNQLQPVEVKMEKNKLVLKFSVKDLAKKVEKGSNIPIKVTGSLDNGLVFEGNTTITVK
ncbi:bacterial Ig-like domain-containing protein [Sutcliffiella rhizosphaerae]|uniref:Pectate disaccharide-lyase n=1 Tax=Sutcliffiella rhizosphaerae TaxID=2880967 RepID=A0ABM8YJV8_9BACI|nr:bacterial Ig-like domain-containing protein [Sutcliffiella rhizosphaerae]CAG9620075.1 hypothetical protein BACCIP111883_00843 [Sutcliffiella rhizosphaerae]